MKKPAGKKPGPKAAGAANAAQSRAARKAADKNAITRLQNAMAVCGASLGSVLFEDDTVQIMTRDGEFLVRGATLGHAMALAHALAGVARLYWIAQVTCDRAERRFRELGKECEIVPCLTDGGEITLWQVACASWGGAAAEETLWEAYVDAAKSDSD